MKYESISEVIAVLLAIIIISVTSFAQEKKIDKKDLPKEVIESFQKAYPNAQIKGTSTEKENGITYYEIESMEGVQGRDLLYTFDGKVAEIEEAIALNAVPSFVKESIMKKYPKWEISKAEKVTKGGKYNYEVVVKQGSKQHEVVMDSKGNIKKMENMKKENEEKEGKENDEEKEDNDKD